MAAKKVITDLDLGQNKLINLAIDPRTTLPITPVTGQTCFHSTAGIFVGWDGSAWQPISPSISATAPTSPIPGQRWLRTTDNITFYRNAFNNRWVSESVYVFNLAINSTNVNISSGIFFDSTAGSATSTFPITLLSDITIIGITIGTDNTNGPWFLRINDGVTPWNAIHTIVVAGGATNFKRSNLSHRIISSTYPKISVSANRVSGSVSSVTFAGTGLNNLSTGGTYAGTGVKDYLVQIDSTGGTDTFRWSNNGGATFNASNVSITGSPQTLSDGVTITFATITGHTLNDAWHFSGFVGSTSSIRRPRADVYYRLSI